MLPDSNFLVSLFRSYKFNPKEYLIELMLRGYILFVIFGVRKSRYLVAMYLTFQFYYLFRFFNKGTSINDVPF